MAQELSVVLNRRDSNGFGFSVLGKPGFPPVIYDIIENSPAAESGKVSIRSIIVLRFLKAKVLLKIKMYVFKSLLISVLKEFYIKRKPRNL